MTKTCAFFGNDYDFIWRGKRNEQRNPQVRERVKEQVVKLIEDKAVDTFLVGEIGGYERDAYDAVLEVQKQYPNISVVLVISKITELHPVGEDDSDYMYHRRHCDDWVFPDKCQQGYRRLTIVYRNRWIVENTDYIIGYNRYQGRAYEFIKQAKSKGVEVIELTDLYTFD